MQRTVVFKKKLRDGTYEEIARTNDFNIPSRGDIILFRNVPFTGIVEEVMHDYVLPTDVDINVLLRDLKVVP